MDTDDRLGMSSYWWVLTIRGMAAIFFGMAAVFWPGLTLVTLVYLFSAYVLVFGVVDMVHGLNNMGKDGYSWVFTLLLSFLEVGVGVYLLRHVDVAFVTLISLIGFVLIVKGVIEVVMAYMNDHSDSTRALLTVAGVVTMLAGMVVLKQPGAGGVAFVWILGVFALVTGPISIALSMEVKKHLDTVTLKGRKARVS